MSLLALPADLPPAVARAIQANAYQGMPYKCIICHKRGHLGHGSRVTVKVRISRTAQIVVKMVHVTCGRGGLVHADHDLDLTVGSVTVVPMRLPGGWPALLVELNTTAALFHLVDDGGDGDVDVIAAGLLSAGMGIVADIAHPPQPPHPHWRVHLFPHNRHNTGIRITGPDGLILADDVENLVLPPGWTAAVAAQHDHCAVYQTIRVGLMTHVVNQPSNTATCALNTAARDGRIVGVIANVTVRNNERGIARPAGDPR